MDSIAPKKSRPPVAFEKESEIRLNWVYVLLLFLGMLFIALAINRREVEIVLLYWGLP